MKNNSHRQSKSVLMVAFHFPPIRGSSGLQRTLGFTRHLPQYGWRPIILTTNKMAYPDTDNNQLKLIPSQVVVERSFCLDTARHLSIGGKYPGILAIPDRWISWVLGGVISGLRATRRYKPTLIWTTYPIATAHIIGRLVSLLSGIPWVADFRDPMVEKDPRTGVYTPSNPVLRRSRLWVERLCAKHADALVFCTAAARDICIDRYHELSLDRCYVISNGFEESLFLAAEEAARSHNIVNNEPTTFLHSGTIYPTSDRDPTPFFNAVAQLLNEGRINSKTFRVKLRATGHDDSFKSLIADRGIQDIVNLEPPISYMEALEEMLSVDGLLLFQGYDSNPAIPAKLYEYLRAKKPILALVDSQGSTAQLLREIGFGRLASIESSDEIKERLARLIEDITRGKKESTSDEVISRFSRAELTREVVSVFEKFTVN